MKFFSLLLLIFFCDFSWAFSCLPHSQPEWKTISQGVEFLEYRLSYSTYDREGQRWNNSRDRKVTIRVLRVDLESNSLSFWSPLKKLKCNSQTKEYISLLNEDSEKSPIASVNSNFFNMQTQELEGVAIDLGRIWANDLSTQTISSSAILGLGKEVLFEKKDFLMGSFGNLLPEEFSRKYNLLVQGYPQLTNDNSVVVSDRVLNTRRARTAIGQEKATTKILLITVDAQGEGDLTGMTLYEFGHLLNTSSCGVPTSLALNLDGGGSSAISVPSLGISHQASRCRALGNILQVTAKKSL